MDKNLCFFTRTLDTIEGNNHRSFQISFTSNL
jgi:hypothetical protein